MKLEFDNDLIFTNLNFNNSEEVLEYLSKKLIEKDLVFEKFTDAILKREQEYPTGIPAKISVAIPHADSTLVKTPAITIGVLNKPVTFQSMENPINKLNVQLVIMLAVQNSKDQLKLLQNIISLIQNENDIEKILKSNKKNEIRNILKNYF